MIIAVQNLLRYILKVAKSIAVNSELNSNVLTVPLDYQHLSVADELMTSGKYMCLSQMFMIIGVCFPGRPVTRVVKKIQLGPQGERCSKNYKGNSKLGAGVVLFWCADHRKCLKWVVLTSSESLEIVYTTILTRFPKIPRVFLFVFC